MPYSTRQAIIGIMPEPKLENGKISNLDEIKSWLLFNSLEVHSAFNVARINKLTENEMLWLAVCILVKGKEEYIKILMDK